MTDLKLDVEKRLVSIRREYDKLAAPAVRLCEELKRQVGVLLDHEGVRLAVPLMARVKEWASISDKLGRRLLPISKLEELQDFVGVRAITIFERDCSIVSKLVEDTFRILKREDKRSQLKPDRFGYASLHYIVRPPESWLALPTLDGCEDLRVEIQIRTLAQHTWAEASHKLQYKQEKDVPEALRRGLFRASALLELIDLEFGRVLVERERLTRSASYITGDSPLNGDTLARILDEALPAESKSPDEDYSDVLDELQHFGVSTADQLRTLLARHMAEVGKKDKARVDSIRQLGPTDADEEAALAKGAFFSHTGLVRSALDLEVGHKSLMLYQLRRLNPAWKAASKRTQTGAT